MRLKLKKGRPEMFRDYSIVLKFFKEDIESIRKAIFQIENNFHISAAIQVMFKPLLNGIKTNAKWSSGVIPVKIVGIFW